MNNSKWALILMAHALLLAACGAATEDARNTELQETAQANDMPAVTFKPTADTPLAGKPGGPVSIAYQIIGKPVLGEPLAIDLRVRSALAISQVDIAYRIGDTTALRLADAQPASATLTHVADDADRKQQVRVVPLREGRVYLNVSATVQTQDGSVSTVSAIPIQVGSTGPQKLKENGTLETDSSGNAVRVLQGSDK